MVVSVSYRLGAFGYLHDEENGTVNLGLKDQIMALRWVQRNIGIFGGDPARVTIAGQSAGGQSVAAIIANTHEPLFTQAIIHSAPLAMQPNSQTAKRMYHDFLALLGKPYVEATMEEVLAAQRRYIQQSRSMMPFGPILPRYYESPTNSALQRVWITYQREDASPFVAMALHHEACFGSILDRLATRIATNAVFAHSAQRYARHLQRAGVEVSVQCLDTQPEGSSYGSCHCLELAWLFGRWHDWQAAPLVGAMSQAQWQEQSRLFRRHWTDFVKGNQ